MNPRPERVPVGDRLEIIELMASYSWALDTGDVEAWVDCFAPDGGFDSVRRGFRQGADELRAAGYEIRDSGLAYGVQHWVTNTVFHDYAGDSVHARSQIMAPRSHDGEFTILFTGFYRDHFVRIDDRWKIRHRRFRYWQGDDVIRPELG